jgi:hypothetical protein
MLQELVRYPNSVTESPETHLVFVQQQAHGQQQMGVTETKLSPAMTG